MDFVIIDFNLGKQPVSYDGMDVLKYIRERDPEIYLIYLTSMDFSTEFLPQFDQQIRKKDMHKEIDVIINRLNRAISRELSIKLEREIDNNYKLLEEKIDADIEYLKKLFEDGEKQ